MARAKATVGGFAYGAVVDAAGKSTLAARQGERVVDLAAWAAEHRRLLPADVLAALNAPDLMALLASGPEVWGSVDRTVASLLSDGTDLPLLPASPAALGFAVADFVDFYASRHHAENVGRIFRPTAPALPAAWLSLPVGYHGRAGSVVVSGTPVSRPWGLIKSGDSVHFAPTAKLDIEAEIGFVVGVPSQIGQSVSVGEFDRHVFGVCVVNDWSARDIQAFEYVPLGPFLGKSFATTVSPWVTPLSLLGLARVQAPSQNSKVQLAEYLREEQSWGLDITMEVEINGAVVSRPPYSLMHWSPAQMLAHMTVNGAPLRTGDLFASGTVSGTSSTECGSLLEMTRDATQPLVGAQSRQGYLEDGDEVRISAFAQLADGTRVDLYEAASTIKSARNY